MEYRGKEQGGKTIISKNICTFKLLGNLLKSVLESETMFVNVLKGKRRIDIASTEVIQSRVLSRDSDDKYHWHLIVKEQYNTLLLKDKRIVC